VSTKRASRPKPDQHELLRSRTFAESEVFVAELQSMWRTSMESARLAIAATPALHKREVLLSRVDELAWLLSRHMRQSLVARFEIGRGATIGPLKQLTVWCNEDVQWDIATALIPGATGNDEDNLAQPWARFGSMFFLAPVADWVKVACVGWEINIGEMLDWRAPGWAVAEKHSPCSAVQTRHFLREIARTLEMAADSARNLAYEKMLDTQLIGAIADLHTDDTELREKLKRKTGNLDDFPGVENLTEIQRQCLSLQVEHGLSCVQIAAYLRKDRKTVKEHLDRGAAKLGAARAHTARQKNRAKKKPGGLDSL
jgi:DNA-binding CsgD family transcriptional regulator